jgi:hypothetical protein
VDPRTGEIIKGHVSLGSLRIRQDFLIAQALLNKPFENDDNYQPMLDMAIARIKQLSAHEVGHTIGFAHNFAASTTNRSSVMDYPHPLIKLDNGEVNLNDAYATGIGDWDKVTVAYSYSQFSSANEKKELDAILDQAYKSKLRFITDYDARSVSGAHMNAHLWDNSNNISDGLNEVLEVRKVAINNFSKYNIRSFEPYSKLEDVFVPLYFLHRYQTEATVKLIGGLDYNYATRDDNQLIVKDISFNDQNKALTSILKTLSSENLAIPTSKLDLFPPRAFGFKRSRESFKSMTGVSFDPLSAASTSSEFTLSLLLNVERMNRLVVQSSLNNSTSQVMSLEYLFKKLTENTFENKILENLKDSDYLVEVQQTINNNYLKYLLNLSANDNSFFQLKAEANKEISRISDLLNSKKYSKINNNYKSEYLNIIRKFKSEPELFKIISSPKIPDGSPIGTDSCNYIY